MMRIVGSWLSLEHVITTLTINLDRNEQVALEVSLIRNIIKRWKHPNASPLADSAEAKLRGAA